MRETVEASPAVPESVQSVVLRGNCEPDAMSAAGLRDGEVAVVVQAPTGDRPPAPLFVVRCWDELVFLGRKVPPKPISGWKVRRLRKGEVVEIRDGG